MFIIFKDIAEVCKSIGAESLLLLGNMKEKDKETEVSGNIASVKLKIEEVIELVNRLTSALKGDSLEQLVDLVESELSSMDKAIEEAAARIEVSLFMFLHIIIARMLNIIQIV